MAICPYCLEEIKDGARRCRHCQAELEAPSPDSDRVTYILDRGLIRFGKFAAATFALFAVFGVYVFGFDLKELVKEMGKREKEIAAVTERLEQAKHQLDKALAESEAARITVEEARVQAVEHASEAKQLFLEIRDYHSSAVVYLAEIRRLTPEQEQTLATAKAALTSNREAKLWPVGATLRVRFLDGSPVLHERVERVASEWTEHANIGLEFGSNDQDAEIRVSFSQPGSWSYVGTDALAVPSAHATINFGQLTKATPSNELHIVLHEFGHVLGLVHEHQNPVAEIEWNEDVVYTELAKPPGNWDRATVDLNILRKHTEDDYPGRRHFDPQSIMIHGVIPAHWHKGDADIGLNTRLSESDKAYVQQLYPFEATQIEVRRRAGDRQD